MIEKAAFISRLRDHIRPAHELVDGETAQNALLRRMLWDTIEQLETRAGILVREGVDVFTPILEVLRPFEAENIEGVKKFRVDACLKIAYVLQATESDFTMRAEPLSADTEMPTTAPYASASHAMEQSSVIESA